MIEYISDRISRLRAAFTGLEIDAILVSQPENRYYLSGFEGSTGYLLISKYAKMIAVDFRYVEQAKMQCPGFDVFKIEGSLKEWLPRLLLDHALGSLGLESDFLKMAEFQRFNQIISEIKPGIKTIPTMDTVHDLRMIKDSYEIGLVSEAVKATEYAMDLASEQIIKPGISEKEAAWQIEKYIREAGGELAFPIIIAGGAASAMPHAQPTERLIHENEPVVVDLGVKLNNYCGDLTRTFWFGEKNKRFEELYHLVLEAQTQAIAKIKHSNTGAEADAFARDVISQAGYGQEFGHSLGHGIGLAVHELPRIGVSGDSLLSDGMIFTIEPGVYIPGWGGIRIEDDVVLECGKIRQLSKKAK